MTQEFSEELKTNRESSTIKCHINDKEYFNQIRVYINRNDHEAAIGANDHEQPYESSQKSLHSLIQNRSSFSTIAFMNIRELFPSNNLTTIN